MEWCISEYAGKLQPYIYEIILDEEQILRISTDEEFEDNHHGIPEYMKRLREIDPVLALFPTMPFVNGYGCRLGADHIDYPKVAEKYGGIEITPLLHRKRLSAAWYYGWDCASGCVWSRKAIRDIRLFARYDRHLQEYVRVKDSVYNRRKK